MQTLLESPKVKPAQSLAGILRRWAEDFLGGARPQRQLRLGETLGLGEKRLLAVVEFEQQRFLIGATATSVALLASLSSEGEHDDRCTNHGEHK